MPPSPLELRTVVGDRGDGRVEQARLPQLQVLGLHTVACLWKLVGCGWILLAGCTLGVSQPASVEPVRSPDRTPVAVAIPAAATGPPGATPPALPASANVENVYVVLERNQCLGCHAIGNHGAAGAGNSLNGLAQRVARYNTGQSPAAYVRQSLLEPSAYLAPDCPGGPCANIMPSYRDRLSEAEITQIVDLVLRLPPTP